ncbi:BUD13 homolog isoform X3 [Halyomorpha halys]|uniref:BUD13 homolog isoform X2 n=1 Tax=Halyomorpha halys TaxID=286706 RepID=UPI000D0C776C|nr:BUD13 homolog isoform X3 [Halyomorpha halys]
MSFGINPFQKPELSQKEYLKRYLSKDKGEKKKKKVKISSSSHLKRSVIIDDDLGLPNVASVEDEEYNLDYLGDEAPQIAGIIDERPPEIKAKESHGDNSKWKPLGDPGGSDFVTNKHPMSNGQSNNENSVMAIEGDAYFSRDKHKYSSENTALKDRGSRDSDSDLSPPRSRNKYGDKSKKRNKTMYDSDVSPPRKSRYEEKSKRRGSDSDLSPSRKNKYEDRAIMKGGDSDFSPPRKDKFGNRRAKRKGSDSDLSPPRKNKYGDRAKGKGSDSDLSPPRRDKYGDRIKKKGNNSDLFLPRRNKYGDRGNRKGSDSYLSPPRKNKYEDRAKRTGSDSDLSPPRKHKNEDRAKRKGSDSDLSPPRKHKNENRAKRKGSDSDLSPPRKHKNEDRAKRNGSDSDLSPPRKNRYETKDKRKRSNYNTSPPRENKYNASSKRKGNDYDLSPPRKNKYEEKARREQNYSDLSPPRKNRNEERSKRRGTDSDISASSKNHSERNDKRLDKTLDGKKAGLQDAKNLKEELNKLKEQENALFDKMKASVSGQTAAAIKRDRKTGKIRDTDKEKEEEVKKSTKVIERENKYARWGKGLKQIEEAEERVADYLHEVNKPLARYADDQDLDRMLKAREREGDPMLDYIKNKQAESIDVDNRGKPTYQGYYLPNRFNIRPGHRWDGVDRSNGYEKQWFEKQNARKALQEEAYKWSTSDM